MNDMSLKTLLKNAEAWPEEDRQELADYARIIEARRKGLYKVDQSERLAIEEGLEDATEGRFVGDAVIADSAKRFRA